MTLITMTVWIGLLVAVPIRRIQIRKYTNVSNMIYRIRFDIHYSLDGGAVGKNFHFACKRSSVGINFATDKFLKMY